LLTESAYEVVLAVRKVLGYLVNRNDSVNVLVNILHHVSREILVSHVLHASLVIFPYLVKHGQENCVALKTVVPVRTRKGLLKA